MSHVGTNVAIILKQHSPADRAKGKANYANVQADPGRLGNVKKAGELQRRAVKRGKGA